MNYRGISSARRQQFNLNIGKQRGAVAVIVALSIVGLIGFIGLALDLGKLFITKTELQNSADACALAAARELTGTHTSQLILAEEAGITAGTLNNVFFQQYPVTVSSSNVTFSETLEGSYVNKDAVTDILKIRFVRCTVERTGIANWFIQVLGIGDQQVNATAVASLVPGQTTCALPVAVCSETLTGKEKGDWLQALLDAGNNDGLTGDFLWANVSSNQTGQGTREIKDMLTSSGECNIRVTGEEIGEPGGRDGAVDAWNTRFGIYQGKSKSSNAEMDFSGYAYTHKNWPSCKNAYAESNDFITKRSQNLPLQDPKDSDSPGLQKNLIGSSVEDHQRGGDRRIVPVPVVDCSDYATSHKAAIQSWACVLMLHPLDHSTKPTDPAFACPGNTGSNMFLEYLGKTNEPDSPCATTGMAGASDSIGPLVPALVQ